MTERDRQLSGFMANIVANPDDDTHRLVMADWLQDEGNEWRADFIRLSIDLHRREPGFTYNRDDAKALAFSGNLDKIRIFETAGAGVFAPLMRACEAADEILGAKASSYFNLAGGIVSTRGFIEELTIDPLQWYHLAPAVYWHPDERFPCPPTAMPLKVVTFTHTPVVEGVFAGMNKGRRLLHSNKEFIRVDPRTTERTMAMALCHLYWSGIRFGVNTMNSHQDDPVLGGEEG